jgi:hypothetical protein
MALNSSNFLLITSTLAKNNISEKRINNMINTFSKYNISIIINDYEDKNIECKTTLTCLKSISNMKFFQKSGFDYAIICDNDFNPIDNFLDELNKTIELLPENWRVLHLCPGYLWGRLFRDSSKIGKLNPEYNMDGIEYHPSGRFYLNCDKNVYFNRLYWFGGPVAFIVNKNTIDNLLESFINEHKQDISTPNDVVLVNILTENDYVCREPMLGYENPQGGTTFK